LELDLGEPQEAERFAQLGYAAGVKAFSQILSFGSEDQRLAYQHLLHPYTLFAAFDQTDALLASTALHYKGVVLDSIIEDRLLAETGKEKAGRDLVDQLSAKKRLVAQLSLQTTPTSPKEDTERIQALEQEVEDIESKLARQVADLGQARRALATTVEQVQRALPNDTVLIEYVRYRRYLGKNKFQLQYGAVVLSAATPGRWVTLGTAKEIEATLKRYQVLVRNPGDEEEMSAVLAKIDDEVWKPVEQAFPGNTNRVIVSPDGQLNFLSFAALHDPDKGFVAEKYLIRYVTSGRDLLREPEPASGKQVIVMANPKFDRDIQLASIDPPSEGSGVLRGTEKRDIGDLSFEELGGTQKESAELMPKFEQWGWQARSVTGSDVSKRALMKLHGPYILHLATHGFFEPDDSTSAEANPNDPPWPESKSDLTRSQYLRNPMHRSGLALAGANTTIAAWKRGEAPPIEEDGILTAEDVSTLDLKGTWLVTLSACDTGCGEARAGEGVMGLRRGFIEAGAQNLLMSLWPISDEFTVQIMSDFYEAAHESGNAPEALAKVQRDWLVRLSKERGLTRAVNLAGPFIMSSQGRQSLTREAQNSWLNSTR
jgi:CHAT domain-containing protein